MESVSKVTVECPRCGSTWMHYPDSHLPDDPASCQRCGRTYAYGDLLEVAELRVLSLVRAERQAAERVHDLQQQVGPRPQL